MRPQPHGIEQYDVICWPMVHIMTCVVQLSGVYSISFYCGWCFFFALLYECGGTMS